MWESQNIEIPIVEAREHDPIACAVKTLSLEKETQQVKRPRAKAEIWLAGGGGVSGQGFRI